MINNSGNIYEVKANTPQPQPKPQSVDKKHQIPGATRSIGKNSNKASPKKNEVQVNKVAQNVVHYQERGLRAPSPMHEDSPQDYGGNAVLRAPNPTPISGEAVSVYVEMSGSSDPREISLYHQNQSSNPPAVETATEPLRTVERCEPGNLYLEVLDLIDNLGNDQLFRPVDHLQDLNEEAAHSRFNPKEFGDGNMEWPPNTNCAKIL